MNYSDKMLNYVQDILIKHYSKRLKIIGIEHQEDVWTITYWDKNKTPSYVYKALRKCSKDDLRNLCNFLSDNLEDNKLISVDVVYKNDTDFVLVDDSIREDGYRLQLQYGVSGQVVVDVAYKLTGE